MSLVDESWYANLARFMSKVAAVFGKRCNMLSSYEEPSIGTAKKYINRHKWLGKYTNAVHCWLLLVMNCAVSSPMFTHWKVAQARLLWRHLGPNVTCKQLAPHLLHGIRDESRLRRCVRIAAPAGRRRAPHSVAAACHLTSQGRCTPCSEMVI